MAITGKRSRASYGRRGISKLRYRRRYRRRRYGSRRAYSGTLSRQARFFNHVERNRYSRLRCVGGFPQELSVKLKYIEQVAIDPTSSAVGVHIWNARSCHDPNESGIGHQPMYWDEYKRIYSEYKVNYVVIKMRALSSKIVNTTTVESSVPVQYFAANERATRMFILLSNDVADYSTSLNNMIEEGNTNLRWCYAPNNTSLKMPQVKHMVAPHHFLKVPRNDASLWMSTSAGGTNCYFIAGAASIDMVNNPHEMYYEFNLTYYVSFRNKIENQTQN